MFIIFNSFKFYYYYYFMIFKIISIKKHKWRFCMGSLEPMVFTFFPSFRCAAGKEASPWRVM